MRSALSKLRRFVGALWFFSLAQLYVWRYYDRKYITGQHFSGSYGGLFAPGWKWVVTSARACRYLRENLEIPWPVSARSTVMGAENISFHPDNLDNFQSPGCYFQAAGSIVIGEGTYIAANVGIITMNHDVLNPDLHVAAKPVSLGQKCWIGMNSMILPGVTLGDHTVVGAGSIVTKSFPNGHCVIAGNPARLIRELDIPAP